MTDTEQTEIDAILDQFAADDITEDERDWAIENIAIRGRRRRITEVAA